MSIRFCLKILLTAILISVCFQPALTQESVLIRSTLSAGTPSGSVFFNRSKIYSLQSIGQASVIGSFSKSKLILRQGFLQPDEFREIRTEPVKLKADIYPNPFLNSFTISFVEEIKDNLTVTLYSINGVFSYSGKFAPLQKITINPGAIPPGLYIIIVWNGKQQYTSGVIKK
jgi:hypothetical protein